MSTIPIEPTGNQDEDDYLYFASILTNTISLVASVIVMFVYVTAPEIRTFALLLVFYLCLSNFLYALGNLIGIQIIFGIQKSNFICYAQAFLTNFGALASICWTSLIAYSLYSTIIHGIRDVSGRHKTYILIAYGGSLVFSIIPFITMDYGQAGDWCWITVKENPDGTNDITRAILFRLFEFYGPLWIAITINSFFIYKVIATMRKLLDNPEHLAYVKKFRYYPIILMICWTPATINRIQNFISPNPVFALNLLHIIFGNLQGLGDAIIYGLTPVVRLAIFKKCCFERKNSERSLNSSNNFNEIILKRVFSGTGKDEIEISGSQ